MGHRRLPLPDGVEGLGQGEAVGGAPLRGKAPLQNGRRLLGLPLLEEGSGPGEVGLLPGGDGGRFGEGLGRLSRLPQAEVDLAQVEVPLVPVREDPGHLVKGEPGLFQPAKPHQGHAEAEVGLELAVVLAQHLLKGGHGLRVGPLRKKALPLSSQA